MNDVNKCAMNRELFSELKEYPIHLPLIHMLPPFAFEFCLQINGEALWKGREVRGRPEIAIVR